MKVPNAAWRSQKAGGSLATPSASRPAFQAYLINDDAVFADLSSRI